MRNNSPVKGDARGAAQPPPTTITNVFCVFINTLIEGEVPAVRDAAGRPVVFQTEHEAQRDIADNMITRLQEFMEGEREFADALTLEEYVLRVQVLPDGAVINAGHPADWGHRSRYQ
jgi:hypothetical protein